MMIDGTDNEIGKIYYFPMPQQDQLDSTLSASNRKELVWSFHQLPKLVYVPLVWGEEDKVDWRMMKHSSKKASLRRYSVLVSS